MSEQENIRLDALQAENEALRQQNAALLTQRKAVEEINKELTTRISIYDRLLTIKSEGEVAPSILTFDEIVNYCGYSKDTIYRLTSKRLIPHYKRENKLFFKRDEIDRWLLADKVKTQEEIAQEAETYCALNKH